MVALALLSAGCGLLGSSFPRPAGPPHDLGPVPTFTADGGEVTQPDDLLQWTRRSDGWCVQFDVRSCVAETDGLPEDDAWLGLRFPTRALDRTCAGAVTGPDVARIEVTVGDGAPITLPPLAGSDALPVNVFHLCWTEPLGDTEVLAEAFTADGVSLGQRARQGRPRASS